MHKLLRWSESGALAKNCLVGFHIHLVSSADPSSLGLRKPLPRLHPFFCGLQGRPWNKGRFETNVHFNLIPLQSELCTCGNTSLVPRLSPQVMESWAWPGNEAMGYNT